MKPTNSPKSVTYRRMMHRSPGDLQAEDTFVYIVMWVVAFLGFSLLLVFAAINLLQDFFVRVPDESPLIPEIDRPRAIGTRTHFNEFDRDVWNILPLALAEPPVNWMEAVDGEDIVGSDSRLNLRSEIHR